MSISSPTDTNELLLKINDEEAKCMSLSSKSPDDFEGVAKDTL
eukprot:jgi/Antlo1/794/1444